MSKDPGDRLAAGAASAVWSAVRALAAGGMVIVADDVERENEGDLVMAAEFATVDDLDFLVRYSTGIICVPMLGDRLDALRLPPMVRDNEDTHDTAFTVSVDHRSTTTGVSAVDRSRTIRALADPRAAATDFRRPGHVFPLRYREGGVLSRPGHTEASIDLLRLAGLSEVAVIGEIVGAAGQMAHGPELAAFAREHNLPMLTVADLIEYRRATERLVALAGSSWLPTRFGEFRAHAYRSLVDGTEHLALVMGDVHDPARSEILVRMHSECLTGDVVGSLRCDCGTQFERALTEIATEGCGVMVYLRGHEGRGIGLGYKLRAYTLQESGRDTVDANTDLGLPVDARTYEVGASILAALGISRVRLITNNPAKCVELEQRGIAVAERVSLPSTVTESNLSYLRAKRDRMGHKLDLPEPPHDRQVLVDLLN
ncbi:bifunctional 3,4-dihydroxy-2-butanone-4-phosphate synthase/GTP cyclohydrolase II [Mycolicibacterium pulveris]|uniref:bifunctional 3,4-dihydroxy-2-butanone-4-phosphate synthase/GTP cyclohydrolase II n=1 Tax=Mycolicibacterium pulveris TaxID=36813 RepID=UPI0021F2EB7D|nr:bifunctional 3,4-dihydroxy-2-butanone-4-phosphate synthase/GTP cyclohydrolase II [Mycolicibacterium pulveris]